MNLFSCASLLLLATLWECSYSQPDNFSVGGSSSGRNGRCSRRTNEFFLESRRYLNCLNARMQDQLDHVKTSKHSSREIKNYYNSERNRMTRALSSNRCTINGRVAPLDQNMKQFLRDTMGTSKLVYQDINENLGEIIWEAAKEPSLSRCFLHYIREKFLSFIKRETGSSLATSLSDGLHELPVPDNKNYDLKAARDLFDLTIKAYLAAYKCEETRNRLTFLSVLRTIAKKQQTDSCDCSRKHFQDCKTVVLDGRGGGMCNDVSRAMLTMVDRHTEVISGNEIKAQAEHCWSNYKRSVKNKGGRVQLSDLAIYGIRLERALGKLSNKEVNEFKDMMRGVLEAHFNSEFCSNCPF